MSIGAKSCPSTIGFGWGLVVQKLRFPSSTVNVFEVQTPCLGNIRRATNATFSCNCHLRYLTILLTYVLHAKGTLMLTLCVCVCVCVCVCACVRACVCVREKEREIWTSRNVWTPWMQLVNFLNRSFRNIHSL